MPNKGRLTIAVATEPADPGSADQPRVRIDVADTGPGIQPENLPRLFEPFYTTKASGSGLGLAIVRGTVQRHGGTITVRTEAGAGTTFSICLPGRKEEG
jgi:signal transduction histidine kinase